MLTVDAGLLGELLSFEVLIPTLRSAFAHGQRATVAPQRHRHRVDQDLDATLLLGAAWTRNYLGVKVVSVFPRNAARPAVSSTYLLSSGRTGQQLAVLDGTELSRRATLGVSALAASYLARPESRTLLVLGSDRVARVAAEAYRTVLGIDRLLIHGGTPGDPVSALPGMKVERSTDLRAALDSADVVVCLTRSVVLRGAWVRTGTHIHLAGTFGRRIREADDEAVARSAVFVDTPTALAESGDLTRLRADQLRGSLFDLCAGSVAGRHRDSEVTLFKSVGTAIADLATAAVVHNSAEL